MDNYQEGTVAVNPETGEKLVFKNGQWVPPDEPKSAGQRVYNAIQNVPESAKNLASELINPILHPVDTASAIADVAKGYLQKGRELSPPEFRGTAPAFDTSKANAVSEFYKNRYGGLSNIANTAEKDPVGMLADVAGIATAGTTAAAKIPGTIGRIAQTAGKTARAIDPVSIAGNAVKLPAIAAREALGFSTGAGGKSVGEAFSSGLAGGEKADAFRSNMRGNASSLDVVAQARDALSKMREERSVAYTSGMSGVKADPTVLDMQPILKKVNEVRDRGTYKGKIIDESAAGVWQQINDVVQDWQKSNPADFHTPEGLDALKKRIGDIKDSQPFGTPARNAATNVFNVVREQIVKQAPEYGRVMREYNEASDTLEQLEGALSLGQKSQADTALRKLQSIMRNNAQTNYGRRSELGDLLVERGADTLYPALAGQALNSITPRSLSGIGTAFSTSGAALAGHPYMLPGLAATSPRFVGESAYLAGRTLSGPAQMAELLKQYSGEIGKNPIAAKQLAIQLGRLEQEARQQEQNK